MRGFFIGVLRVPGRRHGRATRLRLVRRGILVNAAWKPHQGPAGAADWHASVPIPKFASICHDLCCGRCVPSRHATVTAAQQPSDTSYDEMVNFIQGYVEVYSSLHTS
jgi:hypothetical protein